MPSESVVTKIGIELVLKTRDDVILLLLVSVSGPGTVVVEFRKMPMVVEMDSVLIQEVVAPSLDVL